MISYRTPEAKADSWNVTDAKVRKSGEQTGLDTLVVPTLNGAHSGWGSETLRPQANALSVPPGEYGRKAKTQRN